jgi:hypothetical protein
VKNRPFHPPSREGHRRPYARNMWRIQYACARRNRHTPTILGLIARQERALRDGRVVA